MASNQKKTTTTSKSAAAKGGGKRTATQNQSKGKQTGRKTAPAPQKKPYRREVGAVVCLLLAFFGAIGYFTSEEGAFIALFCRLIKGLCGFGFYLLPPMLLICAWVLAFHRGRPVRLRVFSALILPVLLGAVLHLLLCRVEYSWEMALFGRLWADGISGASGGVVSGLLAFVFQYAFTKVGAMVVFIVLMLVFGLCTFHVTLGDILDYFRDRRDNRPEYEVMEEEKPVKKPARREAEETPAHPVTDGRKAVIDIPVDDGPIIRKEPTTPVTTIRKKKLFDRVSNVVSPDKVAAGETAPVLEEDKPEYEDVPEILPVTDSAFGKPADVSQEPVSEPAPEEDEPIPPPIVREPAVQKVTKEEAKQARDEVSRELEEAMAEEPAAYRYPPLSLLAQPAAVGGGEALSELHANRKRLEETLSSFGVDAHIVNVVRGPSVTRYELELEQGVKLNKITNLSDDIALSLGAVSVRIAPIPDKISTVGIEVPNRTIASVSIREVISAREFTDSKSKVSFAVGKDISGNCIVGNIAKMPHLLIAGTTGSGKSVCTNSLIVSLLYKATPEEVRLIMVDPKMVELSVYNGIPHLLIPVVTDPKKAAGALQWSVSEMLKRYRAFSEVGAKDLASYNNHARREGRETMPQIVIVIDELADLMTVAAREVEESICRVAQMGRASGMHLIIATQRPSADVITGLMKSNIPSRIAFSVKEAINSRIILDTTGAEKLVGKGDMLYAPIGSEKPLRVQGCFVSEEEVAAVVDFVKEGNAARYDESVIHEIERHAEEKEAPAADDSPSGDYDELLPAAVDVVLEQKQASVSMLQRKLKLGYGRAARLVDQMEELGVVGPFEGSKPRQLLITKEQWQEMQFRRDLVGGASESAFSEPVPEEFPYEGDAVPQAPPFDV